MNPEQPSASASEQTSTSCPRITLSRPIMIQFVGKRMTWAFAWSLLNYLVLRANPDCHDQKTDPAQELVFYFPAAKVTLLGWQLDLLLKQVANQSIASVSPSKAERADQDAKIPVISEIFVRPADYDVLADYPADAPTTSQEEHP